MAEYLICHICKRPLTEDGEVWCSAVHNLTLAGAACVHHYVMVSGGMRCKKCGHVMGQPERPGDAAAHIEPRLRPPTRLERFAFRITRRWPDSYVAARLNYADELRAAAPPGLDLLRTQMQETGSIATGVGFPLPWLLLFLSDLGIDENSVYVDVANGRIEVKP